MITVDIQRFSTHLAAIYSNIAKPLLDMILYNYQLSQNVGAESLLVLTIFVNLSARVLRLITPSFGAYTAEEAALAGSLRATQSRLAEASEEIAFYGGEHVEKLIVERDYYGLVMHASRVLRIRLWHGVAEEWIIKWLWGSMGVRVTFLLTQDLTDPITPSARYLRRTCLLQAPGYLDGRSWHAHRGLRHESANPSLVVRRVWQDHVFVQR